MPTAPNSRSPITKRRSIRMALNTPIGLSGYDHQQCAFTMPATATNLNRHGAAIHLPRELNVGSTVIVRNARGTQVSARVVAQLATSQSKSVYAIEFAQENDATLSFWGITFPPLTSRAAIAEQAAISRRRRGIPPFPSNLAVSSQQPAIAKR